MSYTHFSTYERGKIEELNKLGYWSRRIGKKLNRHHSSIARELRRMNGNEYKAEQAQKNYESKRNNSVSKGKYSEEISAILTVKLLLTWSPEQIANTELKGKISFKTIYRWIYEGKLTNISTKVLRREGKKRTCRNLRFYASGTPIKKRPKEVYSRKTFGHWELDTVVSSRVKEKCCVATFIERKTRFYIAIKIPDRTSSSMETAIKEVYSKYGKLAFKTGTTDRGGEFACYKNIEKDSSIKIFFADPYCPHQRGSNEYGNGLLREFYPKQTDFSKINQEEIDSILFLINNRPRKCLGWVSALDSFLHELSHLT